MSGAPDRSPNAQIPAHASKSRQPFDGRLAFGAPISRELYSTHTKDRAEHSSLLNAPLAHTACQQEVEGLPQNLCDAGHFFLNKETPFCLHLDLQNSLSSKTHFSREELNGANDLFSLALAWIHFLHMRERGLSECFTKCLPAIVVQ